MHVELEITDVRIKKFIVKENDRKALVTEAEVGTSVCVYASAKLD